MLRSLIIVFVLAAYVISTWLDLLNERARSQAPHPLVADLYEPDALQRQRDYGAARFRLRLLSTAWSNGLLLLALVLGWFGSLDAWARDVAPGEVPSTLAFFAVLYVVMLLIGLPASVYSVFVIEQRFGFNTTSVRTFVADRLKGLALTVLVGGALLAVITWLHAQLQGSFWLLGWLLVAAFSLFMFMFGTALVLRLFNTLTPVEPGELRTAIEDYCGAQGYTLKRLFVMDGSKRSTKANAFFTGLGRAKTIVLFDTLVEQCSTEEVVAVLAHEIGHYRLRHTLTSFIVSNLQLLATFALLGWMLGYPEPALALGGDRAGFALSLLAFSLLLTPLDLVAGFLGHALSRRHELQADAFAKRTYAGEPLARALRVLARNSLSNPTPHPWYVAAHYTHPPLHQRLAAL